jgi:hypothetical protein
MSSRPAWAIVRPCVKKTKQDRAWKAHSYNPSYSGSGDEEDYGLRPAWSKKLVRSHLYK